MKGAKNQSPMFKYMCVKRKENNHKNFLLLWLKTVLEKKTVKYLSDNTATLRPAEIAETSLN